MVKIELDVFLNGLEYDRCYNAVTQIFEQIAATGLVQFKRNEHCDLLYTRRPNVRLGIGTIETDYERLRELVPAVKEALGEHASYLHWEGNHRGLLRMDENAEVAVGTLEGMFKVSNPEFSEEALRTLRMTFSDEQLEIIKEVFRQPVVTEKGVWTAYARADALRQKEEANIGIHPFHL